MPQQHEWSLDMVIIDRLLHHSKHMWADQMAMHIRSVLQIATTQMLQLHDLPDSTLVLKQLYNLVERKHKQEDLFTNWCKQQGKKLVKRYVSVGILAETIKNIKANSSQERFDIISEMKDNVDKILITPLKNLFWTTTDEMVTFMIRIGRKDDICDRFTNQRDFAHARELNIINSLISCTQFVQHKQQGFTCTLNRN